MSKHVVKKRLSLGEIDEIVEKIAHGEKVSRLCKEYSITLNLFYKIMNEDSLFHKKIDDARKIAAIVSIEHLNDEIDTCDNQLDLAKSKLKADNIRWIASKHARDIYGERTDVVVTATLDISAVLKAANDRVAPMLHQQSKVIDVSPVESISYTDPTTGCEPVVATESIEDLL